MAKTFQDLTDVQRERFEAQLRLAGIDRASVAKDVTIDSDSMCHDDPARSCLTPHPIVVRDLPHLKELSGASDDSFATGSDDHVTYPSPFEPGRHRLLSAMQNPDALAGAMTPDEHQSISDAMRAYLLGNSARVPREHVDLINAIHFPFQGSVFAAENIVISKEFLISGPGPQKFVFGTVLFEKGGYVKALVDCTFDAQVITKAG